MPFITWTNDLYIGIKRIDEEHLGLVDFINQLHASLLKGENRERTNLLFEKLLHYTRIHFTYETKLLHEHRYPHLEDHVEEHYKFIEELQKIHLEFEQNKENLSFELLQFLINWLINHILDSDKKYAPFLLEKGLK